MPFCSYTLALFLPGCLRYRAFEPSSGSPANPLADHSGEPWSQIPSRSMTTSTLSDLFALEGSYKCILLRLLNYTPEYHIWVPLERNPSFPRRAKMLLAAKTDTYFQLLALRFSHSQNFHYHSFVFVSVLYNST